MISKRFSSEGIILARKNYSEADRILTIYSKHIGKIRLVAKGVRRTSSRKRGHVEVFSRVRFSAQKGEGLAFITEAEMITSYPEIRKDLKKVAVAYYITEVFARITHEEEKNENLYYFLSECLSSLSKRNDLKLFRKEFIYKLLLIMGYWPPGRKMRDPDAELENVIEKKPNSVRVGKKILQN